LTSRSSLNISLEINGMSVTAPIPIPEIKGKKLDFLSAVNRTIFTFFGVKVALDFFQGTK